MNTKIKLKFITINKKHKIPNIGKDKIKFYEKDNDYLTNVFLKKKKKKRNWVYGYHLEDVYTFSTTNRKFLDELIDDGGPNPNPIFSLFRKLQKGKNANEIYRSRQQWKKEDY